MFQYIQKTLDLYMHSHVHNYWPRQNKKVKLLLILLIERYSKGYKCYCIKKPDRTLLHSYWSNTSLKSPNFHLSIWDNCLTIIAYLLQPDYILYEEPIGIVPGQEHVLKYVIYTFIIESQGISTYSRWVAQVHSGM